MLLVLFWLFYASYLDLSLVLTLPSFVDANFVDVFSSVDIVSVSVNLSAIFASLEYSVVTDFLKFAKCFDIPGTSYRNLRYLALLCDAGTDDIFITVDSNKNVSKISSAIVFVYYENKFILGTFPFGVRSEFYGSC